MNREEYDPWERGAPEDEHAFMWADRHGPGVVVQGAQPRTVRDVQKRMVLVRMFERFIRNWLPPEPIEDHEDDDLCSWLPDCTCPRCW